MSELVDADYVRETFNIHVDVLDGRITPYIKPASRRLIKWVGAAKYADEDLADELKIAEATLVIHFMIRNLNTAIRPKGLVKTERVEGNTVVEYLTPTQSTELETDYLHQAEELVREMLETAENPPPPEIVEIDE